MSLLSLLLTPRRKRLSFYLQQRNYVLPSSLRFRPALRSAKGYKFRVRTGFSFLKLRIDECHSSILCLRVLFSRSLSEISALINNSKTSWVEELYCLKEQQTFTKQREKNDRKFRHLLSKRSPVNSGSSLKNKSVMNLSSNELSSLDRSGLEKRRNFAIAPHKILTAEIVTAVEESICQLNDDRRHLVRAEVSSMLRRAKPLPKNIQKDVLNALIALKKIRKGSYYLLTRVIFFVVMDKQQYHDKA